MKAGIHPSYDFVVFRDASSDFTALTRSTKKSNQTIKWHDGNEYPVIDIEISSASHPFFTGKVKLLDTAGRVERFNRKYARQKAGDK
jgi:large subunit ribosomal protein L31